MIKKDIPTFKHLLKYIDRCLKDIGFIENGYLNYKIPFSKITLDFIKETGFTDKYIVVFYVNGTMKQKIHLYGPWLEKFKDVYIKEINSFLIDYLKNDDDIKNAIRVLKIKKIC